MRVSGESGRGSDGAGEAAIAEALDVLRSGARAEKRAARDTLARIFEARGQLDYAAECLEANVLDGLRDPILYARLAAIYDRQGDHERAEQARAEAHKLVERAAAIGRIARVAPEAGLAPASTRSVVDPTPPPPIVPPPSLTTVAQPPAAYPDSPPWASFPQASASRQDTTRLLPLAATVPPRGSPLAMLADRLASIPTRWLAVGAGLFAVCGVALVVSAALVGGRASAPTTTAQEVVEHADPGTTSQESARVDPTVAALIDQVARVQATADAARTEPAATLAPSQPVTGEARTAVESLRRVVAYVVTDSGSGTGVSLGAGRFVTNHHVVDDATEVAVRLIDGRVAKARVTSIDPTRDLALLETSLSDAPPASFRVSTELQAAENLYVVGYPLGTRLGIDEVTVTRGIFSARRQARNDVWHVQTDAPMNPGNSGGPVGDGDGNVVGLATWGLRGSDGLNFAVAAEEVDTFLKGGGSPPPAARAAPPVLPAAPRAPSAPAPVTARPELLAAAFGPGTVEPGDTLGLQYEIANSGTVPVNVVLGASIRLGNGPWIDDSGNDTRVTVLPGRRSYTRMFRVPPGTGSGRYDLWVSVLAQDMKTSFGQRSASDRLVVAMRQSAPAPSIPQQTAPRIVPTGPPPPTPMPTARPTQSSGSGPVIVRPATPRPAPAASPAPAGAPRR